MTPSSVRKASHTQENTPSNMQKIPSSIETLSDGPSSPHSKSSSDMLTPTLQSLRRQQTRSLRYIYEKK